MSRPVLAAEDPSVSPAANDASPLRPIGDVVADILRRVAGDDAARIARIETALRGDEQ
jgi:hypothetical protein